MIQITFERNSAGQITGFLLEGHAEYADPGADIVCAAVSALTINCINSVEALTDASYRQESDDESGRILFQLEEEPSLKTQLLLQSLLLGLQSLEEQYDDYLDLIIREV